MSFNLYAVVNFRTCGWCKKFKPVLETNVKAMNVKAQQAFTLVDLDTPEGKAKAQELQFSGGIPCLIATKGETEVYRKAGYQDGATFAQTLFNLYSMYN